GAGFNPLGDALQMSLQIQRIVRFDRRFVERRAIGNDQQYAPPLRTPQQALMRPQQRLTIDVFLQQLGLEHQSQPLTGSPPRFIRALVDDVTQLSNASRLSRSTASDPARARATAAPAAGGETQYLRLDPAALKHPAEQLGANGSG